MSTAPPAAPTPHATDQQAIRIVSHSMLFYWWPVWAFGFLMALWTLVAGQHMALFPNSVRLGDVTEKDGKHHLDVALSDAQFHSIEGDIKYAKEHPNDPAYRPHVARQAWLGPVFCVVLILVIITTNVPLRGLWSVIAILVVILIVILISLFDLWDRIFTTLAGLHIYINMAGYLFIASALFIVWLVSFLFFDQQIYMIFTPGQLKVCTEIGGGEVAYDTVGMTVEKHRNDLFRHWILGLGSGDLTVKTSGAQAHTFNMPNVLFVGRKLYQIEEMQRDRPMVAGGS